MLLALLVISSAEGANSNPPGKMTFQGFLTDAGSPPTPLGNTSPVNKEVTFKIYDNAAGGVVKWAESQIVTVDKGHFSVLLGEGSAVPGLAHASDLSEVFIGSDASDRWLGITVDGSEITPRIQFFAAPYAHLAKAANSLVDPTGQRILHLANGNASVSGALGIGTASPSRMLQVGEGANAGVGGVLINTGWMNPVDPAEARPLDVQIRGDSKLVVNTQGHVGIGTSSPGFKLTIAGPDNVAGFISSGPNSFLTLINNTGFDNRVEFANRGAGRAAIWSQGDHLNVLRNGNVGIGTINPGTLLEVRHNGASTFGVGISLGAPNNNDGARLHFDRFNVKSWGVGIHHGVNNSAFGIFEDNHPTGGFGTPRLSISAGGNVGIGRTGASSLLDVGPGPHWRPLTVRGSDGTDALVAGNFQGKATLGAHNGDLNAWADLLLNPGGRVGIGIQNPAAPLHVRKLDYGTPSATRKGGRDDGYGVYLGGNGAVATINDYNNSAGDNVTIAAGALSAVFDGDIIASSHIWVGNALAYSDARAKKLSGTSEAERDLSLLRSLKVRDFTWTDKTVDNHRPHKKLLAQEVEEVFPQAVQKMQHPMVIPNIYQVAEKIEFDAGKKELRVLVGKAHELSVGNTVDLYTDTLPMKKVEVTAVRNDREFSVACERAPKSVFVYGKYVTDFRSVDYDAIAMLNVSATQELARQVESLHRSEARIAELETKAARVDSLEREMSELKKLVAKLAEPTAQNLAGVVRP